MVLVGMFRCGGHSSWICKGSVSCDWMAFGDSFASHVTNRPWETLLACSVSSPSMC